MPDPLGPRTAEPLRPTTAGLPEVELLAMVNWPVAVPVAVGEKRTLKVAVWPGFNVSGTVAPETVKPAPVTDAALMVIGSVPVEFNATDFVTAVSTTTSSKDRLPALTLMVCVHAFSCSAKLMELEPALAPSVAVCVVVTDFTLAVNCAIVAFAGTVTVAGTVTAALPLERPMLTLSAETVLNLTVQVSVPDPSMVALVQ